MNQKIIAILLSFPLALGLVSCSKSPEQERDEFFRPKFKQAIKDKDYCKAAEIAQRRLDSVGNQGSERDAKAIYEWSQDYHKVEAQCEKAQIASQLEQSKHEVEQLKQQIQHLQQFNALHISITEPPLEVNDESHMQNGYVYTTLNIDNQTDYTVTGFIMDYKALGQGDEFTNQPYPLFWKAPNASNNLTFVPHSKAQILIRTIDIPPLATRPLTIPLEKITVLEKGEPVEYDLKDIQRLDGKIQDIEFWIKKDAARHGLN